MVNRMSTTLRLADALHKRADTHYREYLISQSNKAGAVANLAARLGIPVERLHECLNERADYLKRRNLAHEVQRKLEGKGGLK